MQPHTIAALNQLNQEFYRHSANSFSQTRQSCWKGWEQAARYLLKNKTAQSSLSCLDVGCGNGRFARFLDQNTTSTWQYTGLDTSAELLRIAQTELSQLYPSSRLRLELTDIIALWLREKGKLVESNLGRTLSQTYDLIVVFGVLHHLPSQKLRRDWLYYLVNHLNSDGTMIYTYWQYDRVAERLQKHLSPLTHIDPIELEKGDYILNWQDAPIGRYCHFASDQEIEADSAWLQQNCPDLTKEGEFLADGKTENLNHYLVWRRQA